MNDAEIAAVHPIQPIARIAAEAGIAEDLLIPYGRHMAKVDVHALTAPEDGRVVLVTGISPTPAGEGKTTVTVGLADGLNMLAGQADAPAAVGWAFLRLACGGGAGAGNCARLAESSRAPAPVVKKLLRCWFWFCAGCWLCADRKAPLAKSAGAWPWGWPCCC